MHRQSLLLVYIFLIQLTVNKYPAACPLNNCSYKTIDTDLPTVLTVVDTMPSLTITLSATTLTFEPKTVMVFLG